MFRSWPRNMLTMAALGGCLGVVPKDHANGQIQFGTPRSLGPIVNSSASDDAPSISADGLSLYFSSGRKGDDLVSGDELYVSTRTSIDSPWRTPVNLGPIVNTGTKIDNPSISSDGLTLYFDSVGVFGILQTNRASTTSPWETPERVGSWDNEGFIEATAEISSDGLYYLGEFFSGNWKPFDLMEVAVVPLSLPGDFDGDGLLSVADIDRLTAAIMEGSTDTRFDLNQDDTVGLADHRVWVKDLKNTWFGDSNLDGQFNSSDLVDVLASGTFEMDVDSTWSTGDFNGDGRTTTSDFVVALADGGFGQGPRADVNAVPEPSSTMLMLLGLLGLLRRRR